MSHKQSIDGSMSFLEHLAELRIRIIRFLIVFAVCVLACYAFRKELLDIIKSPVEVPLKKYSAVQEHIMERNNPVPNLEHYTCQCSPVMGTSSMHSDMGDKSGTKKIIEETDSTVTQGKTQPSVWVKTKNVVFSFLDIPVEKIKKKAPVTVNRSVGKLSCVCTPNKGGGFVKENHGSAMVYLGLPELFFSQMKTAIFAGLFLSFPFLIIQIWGFVGPALYKSEKNVFWCFAISTYICFIGGSLFGYFVVFPYGFDFFLSLTEPGEIIPSLSIGQYLTLAIKLLIAFGVIFELPLMTFILARLGILTPKAMIQQSRMALLAICIISALLTPPDPFTMLLMAGPLIILYAIGIGVCFLGLNKQKAALRAQGLEE